MLIIVSSEECAGSDIIYMPVVHFFACLYLDQVSVDSEMPSFQMETNYRYMNWYLS